MTGTVQCELLPPSALDRHISVAPFHHATILTQLPRSTFLKRKGGLFKKAHELSVLCSVDVAVFIFGNNKKLYEYSSSDMRELITRYTYVRIDSPTREGSRGSNI